MRDGAFMDSFAAAIADKRSLVQPAAAFPHKIFAGQIAGWTGRAFDATEDNLSTDICLSAMISVDAEVMCIVEGTLVIPVAEPMLFDLFGNGRGVFAEEACDVLKRSIFGKGLLNVKPIRLGEAFVIIRYKIAHKSSFYCCQKAEE